MCSTRRGYIACVFLALWWPRFQAISTILSPSEKGLKTEQAVFDFGSSPESRRFALPGGFPGVVTLVIEDLFKAGHHSIYVRAYIRALIARKW